MRAAIKTDVLPGAATERVTLATPSEARRGSGSKGRQRWFQTPPPERIGLNGEYDYCGLAKRVRQQLRGQLDLQCLKVRQRGRVVLLSGPVPSPEVLHCLVKLALSVEGADAVETYGVVIEPPDFMPG